MAKVLFECKCGNVSVQFTESALGRKGEGVIAEDPLSEGADDTLGAEWEQIDLVSLQHKYPSLSITSIGPQNQTKISSHFAFLTTTDSHSQLTFLKSKDDSSPVRPLPCDVIYCLNCRSPQFIVLFASSSHSYSATGADKKANTLPHVYATQFADEARSCSEEERELTVEDIVAEKIGERGVGGGGGDNGRDEDDAELEVIKKLQRVAEVSHSIGSAVRSGSNSSGVVFGVDVFPTGLKLDWGRVQARMRQLTNEVMAEIEEEKRIRIQRLIHRENKRAADKKRKAASLLSSIEQGMCELPRCAASRHSSTSTASAIGTVDSLSSLSLSHGSSQMRTADRSTYNPNSASFGDLDQFGLEDDQLRDMSLGRKGKGPTNNEDEEDEGYLVSSNVSEDEEEEAFFTESSGGSSSGIDSAMHTTQTSVAYGTEGLIPQMSHNSSGQRDIRARSSTVYNDRTQHGTNGRYSGDEEGGGGQMLSQSVSQPIYIGSHSFRSASSSTSFHRDHHRSNAANTSAHDNDLHLRMRELSRSVRGESSDIFGDLPDDHRKLDFAQIMRSYTNSSEGILMMQQAHENGTESTNDENN